MRSAVAMGMLAFFAWATAGCGQVRACKTGTLLLEVAFDADAAAADTLTIALALDSGTLNAQGAHTPGQTHGTIELDFAGAYPAGKTVTLMLTASVRGAVVGRGSVGPVTLASRCAPLRVGVSAGGTIGGGEDLAGSDGGAADDMAGSVDMGPPCTTQGAIRCNPTNHRYQQLCDETLHWQDQLCKAPGGVATPPDYACTEAKNKCVDTGWAQWSYTAAMPSPRFSTTPGPSGATQDIVKDAWTGLYWQLELQKTYTWGTQAHGYCAMPYGGYSDWRMPAPIELMTLVDHTIASPGPTVQSPFVSNTGTWYWASTPNLRGVSSAWLVFFYDGSVNFDAIDNAYWVRCVR
jgi:hypothetical protein